MSNAEMPPLACGQVWVDGDGNVWLVGDSGSYTHRRIAYAWEDRLSNVNLEREESLRIELLECNARLIHGPGAPWSPAEEVPHA